MVKMVGRADAVGRTAAAHEAHLLSARLRTASCAARISEVWQTDWRTSSCGACARLQSCGALAPCLTSFNCLLEVKKGRPDSRYAGTHTWRSREALCHHKLAGMFLLIM